MRVSDLQIHIIVKVFERYRKISKYIAKKFIWFLSSGTICPVGVACSSGKNVFLEG